MLKGFEREEQTRKATLESHLVVQFVDMQRTVAKILCLDQANV